MAYVQIEYTFIFNPEEAWSQYSQLDADLSSFLASKGLEAENVKFNQPNLNQSPFKRVLIIKKKETMPPIVPERTIKAVKASLTTSRGFDGKFKK